MLQYSTRRDGPERPKRCYPLAQIIPVTADIASSHFEFNHLSPIQLLLSMGICDRFIHRAKFTL